MMRALLLMIPVALAGAAFAQEAGKSVWQGIYTVEQADRGAGVYAQRCGACHGAALNGTGEAPPLIGGEFVSHWDTMTVGDLYDRVRTTMPQNDPQSLSREDYADVLAFLLKTNGFPAGSQPLDKRSEVLATIGITAEKPAGM
ncbi:class I cytochrome c [Sandarakinorhabdus cyanobacteriorum]|uniref:Class I cytochrome c n=2 Tax=Sandarakinorhabdus cyanobacteriorum TaxID=1981098 RepID=A0A255YS30_9SPHN|nr:class I cytochrome c [Sandarakinorhabdus cyanobacteriorum]